MSRALWFAALSRAPMPARELSRQEYLAAFETWFSALRANGHGEHATVVEDAWRAALVQVGDSLPDRGSVNDFCKRFVLPSGPLRQSIRKSNLLWRLLYGGEALRERPCPEHQGKWGGIGTPENPACPHGCGFTGWLPNQAQG